MILDFSVIPNITPFLWEGVKVTLLLVVIVLLVTAPLALLVALGRSSQLRWISVPLQYLSWIVRGVPPLMILFCVFFIAPQAGLEIDPFPAAVIAMTLFMTFYFAEAMRAGFASVPRGQYQAANALGLPPLRTFRRIIMPQALPSIIPPYLSHATEVVKSSALTATIGVADLTGNAYQMIMATNRPVEIMLVIGCVYAALDAVLLIGQSWAERRWAFRTVN